MSGQPHRCLGASSLEARPEQVDSPTPEAGSLAASRRSPLLTPLARSLFLLGILTTGCQAERLSFAPAELGPQLNVMALQGRTLEDGGLELSVVAQEVERLHAGGLVLSYDPQVASLEKVGPGTLTEHSIFAYHEEKISRHEHQLRLAFVLPETTSSPARTADPSASRLPSSGPSSAAASPSTSLAVNGSVAVLAFRPRGAGVSPIGPVLPDYPWDSLSLQLLSPEGLPLGGITWKGGQLEAE